MKLSKKRLVAVPAALAAGIVALSVTPSASAAPWHKPDAKPLAGMRIVMSNDDSMQMAKPDGNDGKGLYEARKALCAAGADVVVMAPWSNQSGMGTAGTNSGKLSVAQRTALPAAYANDCSGAPAKGAVFGVCKSDVTCAPGMPGATPADTIRLALNGGLKAKVGWDKRPDLVVSGSNWGPNAASVINDSGTIGAALAALEERVPAVAMNAAYEADMSKGLVVTDRTYKGTGEFGAKFIGDLRKKGLLKQTDFAINLNFPALAEGQKPKGTKMTSVGEQIVIDREYVATGDTFAMAGVPCEPTSKTADCHKETKRDADIDWVNKGYATVTPLTGDRTFEGRETRDLERFIQRGK
jgi:5'-nucleotidase